MADKSITIVETNEYVNPKALGGGDSSGSAPVGGGAVSLTGDIAGDPLANQATSLLFTSKALKSTLANTDLLLVGDSADGFKPKKTSLTNLKTYLTGAVTTNYLFKKTSSGFGQSLLFDDGTNVGIGTASPSKKFTISTAGTGSEEILLRVTTTTTSGYPAVQIDRFINTRSATLRFSTAGTDNWVIGLGYNAGLSTSRFFIGTSHNISDAVFFISTGGVVNAKVGTSTSSMTIGGVIFDHFADSGNSGTGQTVLYSDTIPANTFSTNGDKITAYYGGNQIATASSNNKDLRVQFNGVEIYSTDATFNFTSGWFVEIEIIRLSSSTLRCQGKSMQIGLGANVDTVIDVTGLTFSNSYALRILGQVTGTGAASNQLVAKMARIMWYPAA